MTTLNMSIKDLYDIISTEKKVELISTPAGDILRLGETLVGEEWLTGNDYSLSWAYLDNATEMSVALYVDDGWGGTNKVVWELQLQPQGWVGTFSNPKYKKKTYKSLKIALSEEFFHEARLMSASCRLDFSNIPDKIVWKEF